MSDNVAGLGLAQGFMQGFQFMEGIEDRKQRRALTEKQEQRADESHGLQMASTEQTMRYANEEREYKQGERKRIDDARLAQAVKAGFESGNPDPEMMQEYADRFDIDWSNYVNPEFGKSVDVLKQTASGQSGYRLNSPEVLGAFNTVYRKEIQKGIGEKVTRDGKEYTIVGKHASALVPSKDGKSVMIGLDVQAEERDKNGKVISSIKYKAPVTENRSASDEYVKPIDLDKALEQLAGHDLIYRGVQNSPELQSFFNQKLVRLGAVDKDKDADKRYVINGKMVDKDGAVLGDFGNSKQYGELIQHPTLGLVQASPNGTFKQYRDPNGRGSGGGKAPADVQIAEWMVAKGLARDYEDAWNRIKESRSDSTKFVADYVNNEMEMQNLNALRPGDKGYRAPDQIREEAIQAFRYIREQTRGGAGLSSVQQPTQTPQGVPSGQAPTPQSAAGLQTVQQQSAAPKQVPQERIQQLQGMLQSASPDQHAAIKQQFVEAFGQLPEGF